MMKVGATMDITDSLLKFTDRLISVSEFSKGKTSKFFDDVRRNNTEYIVLKNNQPTAIVVSVESYRELVKKAMKMETLLEKIEEIRLLELANSRIESSETDDTIGFEEFVKEQGFDIKQIIADADCVEFD